MHRLLCEMHKVLMTHPGGRGKTPGEVRRSQVWIGGTRPGNAVFAPPPADAVPECLASLERSRYRKPLAFDRATKPGSRPAR